MLSAATPWRAHGSSQSVVSFDKQLDKLALWMETWNHAQRCELIEKLLLHMEYEQYRFLWTVMQPSLHRDFMYSAQLLHPCSNFQPLSTHASRKLRDNLGRNRRNQFHRVKSAYCEFPEEVLEKNALPELTRLRKLSFDSQIRRKQRANFSARVRLPSISGDENSSILLDSKPDGASSFPLLRLSDQPIRRHIQQDSLSAPVSDTVSPISIFKSLQLLPPNAIQVVDWYTNEWNETQRSEFLVKFLLKLDERQHFFISNLLSVKQYKDFISLLPLHVTLKILSYLTPKQLVKASRVCRAWKKVCERNELWKAKCKELNMKVSDYQPSTTAITKINYKKMLKDYLATLENWETGNYEKKKSNPRLASGSMDKSIKIWDTKTGQCTMTLKGHTKGIWSLNFYTSTLLISGSYDMTIRIWNIQTGKCVKTLLGHDGAVWSLVRSDNTLVSGSQDRLVKAWDIRRCVLIRTLFGHQAAVFCVDMDKAGEFAFSSSADHTVRIWNIADGTCTKVIYVNQTMAVMTVSYNEGYLACSYGEFISIYSSAKQLKTFEEHHKRIESIKLDMTEAALGQGVMVSAGKDGLIKYWSVEDEKSIQTFKGSQEQITCVTFDKLRIVMASRENKIKIFDFSPS
ncbi:beta-TrCP-like [Watersipora subatra]|uniref:beta-TrCP-like n=1 Tax=Watersipora subatra TaxID=2589382 RepID=UPI00355B7B23